MKSETLQSPPTPHCIKPKLYNFQRKILQMQRAKRQAPHALPINHSRTLSLGRSLHHDLKWKPKIPAKRLFEEPYFVMSIERKKTKMSEPVEQNVTTISSWSRNCQTNRAEKPCNPIPLYQRTISSFSHAGKEQANLYLIKKPLVNHSLQYLILQNKRRASNTKKSQKINSAKSLNSFLLNEQVNSLDPGSDERLLIPRDTQSHLIRRRKNQLMKTLEEYSRRTLTRDIYYES